MSLKVIDTISRKLKKAAHKIIEGAIPLSVEDATRYLKLNWKANMPAKTGASMKNIYSNIIRTKKGTIGKIVSPANMKASGFFLNVFLETAATPGATRTSVRRKDYRLRRGVFGAGRMARDATLPYLRGVIKTRIRGVFV